MPDKYFSSPQPPLNLSEETYNPPALTKKGPLPGPKATEGPIDSYSDQTKAQVLAQSKDDTIEKDSDPVQIASDTFQPPPPPPHPSGPNAEKLIPAIQATAAAVSSASPSVGPSPDQVPSPNTLPPATQARTLNSPTQPPAQVTSNIQGSPTSAPPTSVPPAIASVDQGANFGFLPQGYTSPPVDQTANEQEAMIGPISPWRQNIGRWMGISPTTMGGVPGLTEGTLQRQMEYNRIQNDYDAHGGVNITPEEFNKTHPGLKITHPVAPQVGEIMYSTYLRDVGYEEFVSRGADGAGNGYNIVAGAAAMALTTVTGGPLAMAVGAGIGAVMGGVSGAGVIAGFDPVTFGLTSATMGLSSWLGYAPKVLSLMAENLTLTTALQVQPYILQKYEGRQVDLKQSIQEAVGSAIVSTGIAKGAHIGADHINWKLMTPEERELILKTAYAQHEMGGKIDATLLNRIKNMRESGMTKKGEAANNYIFTEPTHPSSRVYYGAFGADGQHLNGGSFAPGAKVANDDGMIANNRGGTVSEMRVNKGAQILNLEKLIKPETAEDLLRSRIKKEIYSDLEIVPDQIMRDVFEQVQAKQISGEASQDAMRHITQMAIEEGYHGYSYIKEALPGMKSNQVEMFDNKAFTAGKTVDANKALIPTATRDELANTVKKSREPENSRIYDPELQSKMKDMEKTSAFKEKNDDPIVENEVNSKLKMLQEARKTDPELDQIMKDTIDSMGAEDKETADAVDKLMDCIVNEELV